MSDSKKWYLSKTIWCSIITVLFGMYDLVGVNVAPIFDFTLPLIPAWVFTILGVLVGYSRVVAKKVIE